MFRGWHLTNDSNQGHKVNDHRLLTEVLKQFSRSFYLTLRILPKGLRDPISLAYLLARTADNVTDNSSLPTGIRIGFLRNFRSSIQTIANDNTGTLAIEHPASGEPDILLNNLTHIFSMLLRTPEPIRGDICQIVSTISQGLEMDLRSFNRTPSQPITFFKSDKDLDTYTHLVAGSVGAFWTKVSISLIPQAYMVGEPKISELAITFGKALQMTNILRDFPKDLESGRCYIPESHFSKIGVNTATLTDPSTMGTLDPILLDYIDQTVTRFGSGEAYLIAIPRRHFRMRLAVAWPLLIGLKTLQLLSKNRHWSSAETMTKVTKRWVYGMMALSCVVISSNKLLSFFINRIKNGIRPI